MWHSSPVRTSPPFSKWDIPSLEPCGKEWWFFFIHEKMSPVELTYTWQLWPFLAALWLYAIKKQQKEQTYFFFFYTFPLNSLSGTVQFFKALIDLVSLSLMQAISTCGLQIDVRVWLTWPYCSTPYSWRASTLSYPILAPMQPCLHCYRYSCWLD